MKTLLNLFILFPVSLSSAQDYEWWNVKHNWDGVTSWHHYIITSPAFMGPNALPVPEIKNGTAPGQTIFNLAAEYHHSKGDKTTNLFTKLYIPFCNNKVGFEISLVPLEFYKMDTVTRDFRKTRDYDGKGKTGGDFYFGTFFQIIKDKPRLPDVMLAVNLKTASGTGFEAARFTDSPGYFFDLSAGKEINTGKGIKSIRPYVMTGFYAWQTNTHGYRQDDAFLYGAGFDLRIKNIEIKNSAGGYVGYINNGDRPLVYRLTFKSVSEKQCNFFFTFQQGINDFDYSSFRAGCTFNLQPVVNKISSP
jgi:hypothetical protein